MKTVIVFLLHCYFFATSFGATVPLAPKGFFTNFIDCDGNEMVKFSASVTPFPAVISSGQISLWLGGRAKFTQEAGQFARNISADQFLENIRLELFVDPKSSPIFHHISMFNNKTLCARGGKEIVAREFFQAVHAAMWAPLNSTTVLFPMDSKESENVILNHMWTVAQNLSAPISGQVRAKIKYFDTTVMCVQWNVKTEIFDKLTESDKEIRNFVAAFLTPKVANINNRNQLICPPNSEEYPFGCRCIFPHSGPHCMLQCTRDQVQLAIAPCSPNYEGADSCSFTSLDYSIMCLQRQNVMLLDGAIVARPDDFSSISIRWRMKNYFVMGLYVGKFTIYNAKGEQSLGFFTKRMSYSEGLISELNLTTLRSSEDGVLFNIALESFTIYTLRISLRSTAILDDRNVYIDVGTTNFVTPEDVPKKTEINYAKLTNEEQMEIDWSLMGGHCPGMITHSDTRIWCSKYSNQVFVHNITWRTPFDCRESDNFPDLYIPLVKNCDGGTFKVQLRVATKVGYGDWSDEHSIDVPSKGLSQWETVAVSFGGVLVAVLFSIFIFLYYYKTRVAVYLKSHDLIIRRSRMPLPEPPQSINTASTDDTSSQTTEYASSQLNYVPSSEVSNYIVLEHEEPYSMPSTNTIPASSDEYPHSGSSTSQECTYTEIRK